MENKKKRRRTSEAANVRKKGPSNPQRKYRKQVSGEKMRMQRQKHIPLWRKRVKKASEIMELLLFLLFIYCCFYFMLNFRSYEVDGQSMFPTFRDGERLLTHKGKEIQRYDIVTFEPKEEPGSSFVKRVYGTPGDTIYIKDDRLYLFRNGISQKEIAQMIEARQLPDSTTIVALSEESQRELAHLVQIPEKTYFVLGDNRQNSKDSRSIGLIDLEQIEGVVNFRFYPFDRFGFVH